MAESQASCLVSTGSCGNCGIHCGISILPTFLRVEIEQACLPLPFLAKVNCPGLLILWSQFKMIPWPQGSCPGTCHLPLLPESHLQPCSLTCPTALPGFVSLASHQFLRICGTSFPLNHLNKLQDTFYPTPSIMPRAFRLST